MIKRLRAAWLAFRYPELLDIKDPLTGTLTWKEFSRIADLLLSRIKKGGEVVSLLLLDADGLKRINDTQGYQAGNLFIQRFAGAILGSIRPLDICGRFHGSAGDEFVILFPGVNLMDAENVARRIQEKFPQFSWGATVLENGDDALGQMMERATFKMHEMKQRHRDRKQ